MEDTGRFNLPLIMPQQAQKHVTHNEALTLIDGLLHLAIQSFGENSPPPTAQIDDAFGIGPAPTGDWFGQAGNIALNTSTGWRFVTPYQGMFAQDISTGSMVLFDQNVWIPLGDTLEVSTLPMLGINTAADSTNRIAIRSNAALLTAVNSGDGGNGDLQLKLNKETAIDTGSLLFQTGFSGRAEIGLAGNDDLSVKVSPDGNTWVSALTIDRTSGQVALQANSVSNVALANMAPARLKGRFAAGSGAPEDLTAAQATTLLNTFTSSLKGLAPASGGGTVNFLRADGTWAAPASGGGSSWGGISGTISAQSDLQTALDGKQAAGSYADNLHGHANFTSGAAGFAPASGGGTANFLRADGTWVAPAGGGGTYIPNGPNRYYAFCDCLSAVNQPEWTFAATGTGASNSVVDFADANSIGAVRLSLGTTASARGSICSPNFAQFQLGQGKALFCSRMRLSTLSDAANTWTLRSGFVDSVTAESVDGVFFRYTHSVNGGNFQAVTRSNNVETAVDTGVTAAANTTYKLEVEVNATGTSAEFRINELVVAIISTNIPAAAGRETGYALSVIRTAGTVAVNAYDCDYVLADLMFDTVR